MTDRDGQFRLQIIFSNKNNNYRFGLEGFGSVVTSGTDIDANMLFDLIIGAPKSENAIILR